MLTGIWCTVVGLHVLFLMRVNVLGQRVINKHYFHLATGSQAVFNCWEDYLPLALGEMQAADWIKVVDANESAVDLYIYAWRNLKGDKQKNVIQQKEQKIDVLNHLKLRINDTKIHDSGTYQCSVRDDRHFNALFVLIVAETTCTSSGNTDESVSCRKNNANESHGSENCIHQKYVFIVAAIIIAMLIGAVALIFITRKRRHMHARNAGHHCLVRINGETQAFLGSAAGRMEAQPVNDMLEVSLATEQNARSTFLFKVLPGEQKVELRIYRVPTSLPDDDIPTVGKQKQSFFTSNLGDALQRVFTTYSCIDIVLVDSVVDDVGAVVSNVEHFQKHAVIIYGNSRTETKFVWAIKEECEYIDCRRDTEMTRNIINIFLGGYKPAFRKLCLQHWICEHQNICEQLARAISTTTPPVQLKVEKCNRKLIASLEMLPTAHISNEVTDIENARQGIYGRLVIPRVSSLKLKQFSIQGRVQDVCLMSCKVITVCCQTDANIYSLNTYSFDGILQHTCELNNVEETWSITKFDSDIIVADNKTDNLQVINTEGNTKTISLPFQPRYMSGVGNDIWMYCDEDSEVYQVTITCTDGNYEVVNTHKLALAKCGGETVKNVAVNRQRIVLCHMDSDMVTVHDHSGQLLFKYGGENQLNNPYGVCFDDKNNLFIADRKNCRIVIVDPKGQCIGYVHIGEQPHRLEVLDNLLYVGSYWSGVILVYKLCWD